MLAGGRHLAAVVSKLFSLLREATSQKASFDLVVLSIGLVPRKVEDGMAEVVDLRENGEGFYKSPPTGSGVFVIGTSTGPKDIASSMIDARATVQKVVRFFGRS